MGNHLTTIFCNDISKLEEPRNSYLDILVFDEQQVKEKIKKSKPVAKVIFCRLNSKQEYFQNNTLLFQMPEFTDTVIAEKKLYDLSDIGRFMCITIGRYVHNHFKPVMSSKSEKMDQFVSREHGLIFLNERQQLCYHDIGTFKQGSTNGTKLNDIDIVKNRIIKWNQEHFFALGERLNIIKNNERIMESQFKLRYKKM